MILAACFLSLVPSVFFCFFTRKKVEYFLAASLFGSALLLYLAGCMGHLKTGVYSVVAIDFCMLIYAISMTVFYCLKHDKDALGILCKNIFTPAMLLFILSLFLAEYISRGRAFVFWDEYSHWGRIGVIMSKYDTLPLANKNILHLLMFKEYPPAMALVQYLFVKITGWAEASQDVFYFAKQVVVSGVFALFCNNIKWKDFLFAIVVYVSAFIVCAWFIPNFFISLYVDAVLGILFAQLCYLVLCEKKITWTNSILCFITASFLILTKPSGVGIFSFFSFSLVTFAVYFMYKYIKGRKKHYIIQTIKVLLPFAALLFHVLQRIMLKNAGVVKAQTGVTFQKLCDAWFFNTPSTFDTILNKMLTAIFETRSIDIGLVSVSYFSLAVLISFTVFILSRFFSKSYSKKISVFAVLFLVNFFIYAFFLMLLYVFKFTAYEGTRLASFDRYMATWMIGGVFLVLISAVILFPVLHHKWRYLVLILFFPLLMNYTAYNKAVKMWLKTDNTMISRLEIAKNKITPYITDKDSIWAINQGDSGFMNWTLSLVYLGNFSRAGAGGGWGSGSYGTPRFKGDPFTSTVSEKVFTDTVKKHKFCYVSCSNKELSGKYGNAFACKTIIDKCLYESREGKLYPLSNKTFCFDFKVVSFLDVYAMHRAYSRYSVKKSAQEVLLKKNAILGVQNKGGLGLDNGKVESLFIQLADITGNVEMQVLFDDKVVFKQKFAPASSAAIKETFNPVVLKNIKLKFVTNTQRASLKIKRIVLDYADFQ